MNIAQRGAAATTPPAPVSAATTSASPEPRFPGDLYLDPDVPPHERVAMARGTWVAEATHVWTGSTWCRLAAGVVRPVPHVRPAPVRRGHAEVLPFVPRQRPASPRSAVAIPVAMPVAGLDRLAG